MAEVGLAIAGLVLGCFPVVIVGLEAYKHGTLSPNVRKVSRSLSTARSIYQNAIERLLTDLGEAEGVRVLLDDPGGPAWSQPALNEKLSLHLGGSYKPYLDTLEDIKDIMEELQGALASQAKKPSKTKVAKFIKNFLHSSHNEAGLSHLQNKVYDIDRLTTQSSELVGARRTRHLSVSCYRRVRDSATQLYSALLHGWTCKCETHHLANLLLETRTPTIHDEVVRFRFLFAFRTKPSQEQGVEDSENQSWHELEIRPLKKEQLSDRKSIDDLCTFISTLQYTIPGIGSCLGYLEDRREERYYGLFVVPEATNEDVQGIKKMPLAQILSPADGPTRNSNQQAVSLSTRVSLAVVLSSTMLQLHSTPWLEPSWDKDKIWCAENDTITKAKRLYLRHEFWSGIAMAPSPLNASNHLPPVPSLGIPWGPNEDLYALGVILIELALAQNMESIAADMKCETKDNATTELRTVIEVLRSERIAITIDRRYHGAVYSCIYCNFDLPSEKMKFEHEEFQQNVLNKIVRPLESYLEGFPRI